MRPDRVGVGIPHPLSNEPVAGDGKLRRVVERVVAQHGRENPEPAIDDAAERAPVAMPAGAERAIVEAALGASRCTLVRPR